MNGSILQALNSRAAGAPTTASSNALDQIRGMAAMVKSARNPQAMLMQIIRQNPAMKEVTEIISRSGGDARQAFYTLAKEKGVDPEEILRMLR